MMRLINLEREIKWKFSQPFTYFTFYVGCVTFDHKKLLRLLNAFSYFIVRFFWTQLFFNFHWLFLCGSLVIFQPLVNYFVTLKISSIIDFRWASINDGRRGKISSLLLPLNDRYWCYLEYDKKKTHTCSSQKSSIAELKHTLFCINFIYRPPHVMRRPSFSKHF